MVDIALDKLPVPYIKKSKLNTVTQTEDTFGPCRLDHMCGVGECVAVDDGRYRCRCPHGYYEVQASRHGTICERKYLWWLWWQCVRVKTV